MNPLFKFRGKTYEILETKCDIQTNKWLKEQFEYSISINDFDTIKNRIIGGLKWGWLKEVKQIKK